MKFYCFSYTVFHNSLAVELMGIRFKYCKNWLYYDIAVSLVEWSLNCIIDYEYSFITLWAEL